MIALKGFNQKLKEWVELQISDSGAVIKSDWNYIAHGSIKRYTGQLDVNKEMLWEDDEIIDEQNRRRMFVRFGEYEAYCIEEEQPMKNIGFYMETDQGEILPIGETEEYARKVMQEVGEIAD